MDIVCVVPAGGASSRMGVWKPLLPFRGSTIVETTVGNALDAGLSVVIVSGYRGEELETLFASRPGISVVRNPDWEEGMLGSIQKGLMAAGGVDGVLVIPADMPFVARDVFMKMLAEADGSEGIDEILPSFACDTSGPGHPVFIPVSLFGKILAQPKDGKLRAYLLSIPHRMIPVGDPAIHIDLDTPIDIERYGS